MESVLAILCIVFFGVLTYGLVQGSNLDKYHTDNCRVLYIPEDMDLSLAHKRVTNLDLPGLKKKARELGASREYVAAYSKESFKPHYTDLKIFIIQNSISDEHIVFEDLHDKINNGGLVEKRDYCRKLSRDNIQSYNNCPTKQYTKLSDYEKVTIPEPTNILEEEHRLLKDPYITIQELRHDIELYGE